MASGNGNKGPKVASNVLCFPGVELAEEDIIDSDQRFIESSRAFLRECMLQSKKNDQFNIDMMIEDGLITRNHVMEGEGDNGQSLIVCPGNGVIMTVTECMSYYYSGKKKVPDLKTV